MHVLKIEKGCWQKLADDLTDGDIASLAYQGNLNGTNFREMIDRGDIEMNANTLEAMAFKLNVGFLLGNNDKAPVFRYSPNKPFLERLKNLMEKTGVKINNYQIAEKLEKMGVSISNQYFFLLMNGDRGGKSQVLTDIADAMGVRFLITGYPDDSLFFEYNEKALAIVLADEDEVNKALSEVKVPKKQFKIWKDNDFKFRNKQGQIEHPVKKHKIIPLLQSLNLTPFKITLKDGLQIVL